MRVHCRSLSSQTECFGFFFLNNQGDKIERIVLDLLFIDLVAREISPVTSAFDEVTVQEHFHFHSAWLTFCHGQ